MLDAYWLTNLALCMQHQLEAVSQKLSITTANPAGYRTRKGIMAVFPLDGNQGAIKANIGHFLARDQG